MRSSQSLQQQNLFRMTPLAIAALLTMGSHTLLNAQEVNAPAEKILPRIDVIGGETGVGKAPGSAAVIDGRTLEESRVFNVNEALRKVPGVHVRDEEGVGMRPNIGIRGQNPTRSTKTLLLEDGLPLSFAPYGDNASYYHPPIDRYDSIEVSKGSQVIRFGPQTAGGVINYITPEPQQALGGFVGLAAGTRGYLNGHVMVTGNGAIADIYHKESDGARNNMRSRVDDVNFKWARQLNEDNKIILRATHFQEYSQLTYSGLTQAEFTQLGPRYNPFKNDFFEANRTGVSATHELRLNADAKLLTSVYGAQFDRDWWRQASDSSLTSSLNCEAALRVAGTRLEGSDLLDCKMQGRLRYYTTTGIDSRMQQRVEAFGLNHQLEYGVKFHSEVQRRKQENYGSYTNYLSQTGMTVGENQKRSTDAFSGFFSSRTQVNDRLAVTPIIRFESMQHKRAFFTDTDGTTPDGSSTKSRFSEVIPGIGLTYAIDARNTIYGGVHRGFSPPRVEDAIGKDGGTVDLNAERSVNAEIGLRSSVTKDFSFDAALFRNDFSNLVQVGSIAGGSTKYAEGKALFQGIELAGQLDKLTQAVDGNLFLRFALTHLSTADQKSAFSGPENTSDFTGKRLPYAPENLLNLTLGYRAPQNWNARLDYVYVGSQYSDFANTPTAAVNGDGQTGKIASYGTWNAVANYTIGKTTFFIAGKNLSNKNYIVDRTRGIQVGMPLTVQAGLKYAF